MRLRPGGISFIHKIDAPPNRIKMYLTNNKILFILQNTCVIIDEIVILYVSEVIINVEKYVIVTITRTNWIYLGKKQENSTITINKYLWLKLCDVVIIKKKYLHIQDES